jgi:predicted enzyme related to lactoylglutathione lyase
MNYVFPILIIGSVLLTGCASAHSSDDNNGHGINALSITSDKLFHFRSAPMNMNPVVHFELPAEDRARMIEFYTKTFGWNANQLGPEMNDYVVLKTSETGEDGFPKKPGMINGGLFQKDAENKHPTVVIGVEDIRSHVEKVKEAGGEILSEIMDVPGIGLMAIFRDTEGNRLSMIQPSRM